MPYSHPQSFPRHNAFQQVRYLWSGTIALAGTAGFINSVALGIFHSPVSHMSGAVSRLGLDAADGAWHDARTSFAIIVGFLLGAGLNGLVVGAWKLVPGRRYGVALMIEGGLLGVATWMLLGKHRLALAMVATACGLQNAMSSSYCGLMIRTTHVTGIVTDIGVMLGHWLRHRQIEGWKLRFLLAIFAAFGLGGWIGAMADLRFGPGCLAIPAVGCLLAGGLFTLLYHRGLLDLMQDVVPSPPRTASFPRGGLNQ